MTFRQVLLLPWPCWPGEASTAPTAYTSHATTPGVHLTGATALRCPRQCCTCTVPLWLPAGTRAKNWHPTTLQGAASQVPTVTNMCWAFLSGRTVILPRVGSPASRRAAHAFTKCFLSPESGPGLALGLGSWEFTWLIPALRSGERMRQTNRSSSHFHMRVNHLFAHPCTGDKRMLPAPHTLVPRQEWGFCRLLHKLALSRRQRNGGSRCETAREALAQALEEGGAGPSCQARLTRCPASSRSAPSAALWPTRSGSPSPASAASSTSRSLP